PTKEGYVFDGYYKDPNFTEIFEFNFMPLDGATIYVKWIDIALATKIQNVLKQDIGIEVVVQGIVYCLLDQAYNGYFLYDDTGYIYIHAPNTNIKIGDELTISGKLSD